MTRQRTPDHPPRSGTGFLRRNTRHHQNDDDPIHSFIDKAKRHHKTAQELSDIVDLSQPKQYRDLDQVELEYQSAKELYQKALTLIDQSLPNSSQLHESKMTDLKERVQSQLALVIAELKALQSGNATLNDFSFSGKK